MKYCSKCGAEINEDAVICLKCGCNVGSTRKVIEKDEPNTGLNILAFFFPLIGLMMWLVWKTDYPIKAQSIGKTALISFVISVVFSIIIGCAYGAILGSVLGGYYY